jgi:hypothetical protein
MVHSLKLIIALIALVIFLFSTHVSGEANVTESAKSYRLVVYLDDAYESNLIGGNFTIVVYNSHHDKILSAIPKINFTDNHQIISPNEGINFISKNGQRPNEITVCAQQEYAVEDETHFHDDCYPVKESESKAYWYSTFEYGEIDGFEAD